MIVKQRIRHYRHRNELIATILSSLPNRITKVMFKSGLPYVELKKYIQELERMELLERVDSQYIITEKGSRFLDIYSRMRKVI
jgi:predicted transcriptional regulator